MLSLYLHIPFCRRKCAYCAFYSAPGTEAEKERYAASLTRAIRAAGAEEARALDTVYLGGGTPALLGASSLARVLSAVREAFSLRAGAEITVEANPESTDPAFLQTLREQGVNRLSLGVQSLNDAELRTLGRLHTAADARAALERIFAAGFANVNADVMYGVPGQTAASFGETLAGLFSYPITHLSAYALQWEPETPLGARPAPMDEDREYALYQQLCETAREHGFSHYEISNFARAGFESRHNTAYWKRTEYLGLGAAAHSFYRGKRWHFPADRASFCEKPWPLRNPEPVEDPGEEELMLGLRLREGVPLAALPEKLSLERYRDFAETENGRFRLNERGFYLSNTVIAEILAKRDIDKGRQL